MIAGDSGECYLSTEDLATLAMMSAGKVSQCRKRLIKHGLLEGEIRRDPGYPQPVWHLSIPDLWERNLEWRQDIGDDLKKRIEFKDTQKKSLHVVKASPGEEGITPDEEGIPSGEEGITPDETKEIQKEIQSDNQKGNPSVSAFPKTPAPSPAPDGGDPIDEQAVVDSIAADFLNNTAPEDLQRVTEAKQADAGNWAAPAQAGGDDAFRDGPVDAFCEVLAGINPLKLPSKLRKSWGDKLHEIAKKCNATPEIMERAIRAIPEDQIGWKTFSSPYSDNFEDNIIPLLLREGQPRQKGAKHGARQAVHSDRKRRTPDQWRDPVPT
jgi:hypothetical protein